MFVNIVITDEVPCLYRKGRLDGIDVGFASLSLQASPNTLRSRSVSEGQNGQLRVAIPSSDYRRLGSANPWIRTPALFSPDGTGGVTPHSRLIAEEGSYESYGISRRRGSLTSPSEVVDYSARIPSPGADESKSNSEFSALSHSKEIIRNLSPPSVLVRALLSFMLYMYMRVYMDYGDWSKWTI